MDTLLQDLRYALRSFAKAPGFTALALITIGLGIGVNATVFSFVNALLLRPSPGIPDPGDLVSIHTSDFSSGPFGASSYPDYVSIRTEASAFRGVAAFSGGPVAVTRSGSRVERLRTMRVSGNFFDVLGLQPAAGRLISAGDADDRASVAVISYSVWLRLFGAAPDAIGAQIAVDGTPLTIVGVAPPRFDGMNLGTLIEIYTPLPASDDRRNRGLSLVGRLQPGADLRQAQSQLEAIAARLGQAYPESNRGTLARPDEPRPMAVVPHARLHPRFRSEVAMIGATLTVAVGLVLMIACANVAGLLLSRATARAREVGVRFALGASRGRILRQMLTESVVLGIAGGAFGLLFALWTADALPSFFPAEQASMLDARIDWTVIAFTAAIALASGLIFGLAPAFHGMRSSPAGAMRGEAGHGGDSRRLVGARNVLVVSQVALASVLLVSAVLLARSLANAANADPGFSTRHAVVLSIELPSRMSRERALAYYSALTESVGALPGVDGAAVARLVPVAGGSRRVFAVPGYVPRQGEDMELHINTVDQHYFDVMGIRASAGRVYSGADAPDAPLVVVNQAFATRYFGRESAIGRRIRAGNTELEIIGVVAVDRRSGLQEEPGPIVFMRLGRDFMNRGFLVARTAVDPRAVADSVRRQAMAIDDRVAIFRTVTLEDHLADGVAANRLTATLVAFCGGLAFLLAVVGVYGIVAYAVVRRTREIGVRVALGARPRQVLSLIVREGGRVIGVGIVLGVAAALGATRMLQALLYGISATDLSTFLIVPIAVAAAAMLASCVPAARALRISPVAALRHE
jgi:predicted permease